MISFFVADIDYQVLDNRVLETWILDVVRSYDIEVGELSFVFTSDEYLLGVNKEFLNHDYYTDVITFDYSTENEISGEIYISIDRVVENAKLFNQTEKQETLRVIIHGVLHLLGFNDKTDAEQAQMRELENKHLSNLIIKNI